MFAKPTSYKMKPRLRSIIIPLTIFLLAIAARLIPGPRTIDDAFITYRYARNLLAGDGFVYNPGERVLGTTTPLYTLTLVALGALTGGSEANFPMIAVIVNALGDGITVLLLLKLGKDLGHKVTGVAAALVWAVAPFSVTFAIGGLETSLYVLLLTATVYAHFRDRPMLCAFLAALSLLTRPDALLLLAPLGLARFRFHASRFKEGKSTTLLAEAAVFLVPTVTWFTFATLYFGSPLPHSILAKSLAYRLPQTAALTRLIQHYATPFLGHLTFGIPWIGVGLVIYPFFFVVGARAALKTKRQLWPWAVYPWLYLITFAIANPLIFRWYLTPPLPAFIFFILLGMERFLRTAADGVESRVMNRGWSPKIRWVLLSIVILFPLALSLRGWTLQPDHGLQRPAPEMAWHKLELLYRQAADILTNEMGSEAGSPPPLLAAGDVGVLGFYTPTRILDTVGLNSPQSTAYYPLEESFYTINYAIPPNLIYDQQPDYFIILEAYGREGLLKDPRFHESYALLEKIATDIYGSDGMLIFAKSP